MQKTESGSEVPSERGTARAASPVAEPAFAVGSLVVAPGSRSERSWARGDAWPGGRPPHHPLGLLFGRLHRWMPPVAWSMAALSLLAEVM